MSNQLLDELLSRIDALEANVQSIGRILDGQTRLNDLILVTLEERFGTPFIPGEIPSGLSLLPPIDDGPQDNYGGF